MRRVGPIFTSQPLLPGTLPHRPALECFDRVGNKLEFGRAFGCTGHALALGTSMLEFTF